MIVGIILIILILSLILFDNQACPSYNDLLLRLVDDLRIIQIGGHVGPRWYGGRDPAYRLIFDTRRKTKAIIVEPIKKHFDVLQKNYMSFRDRVILENVAICKDNSSDFLPMHVPHTSWFIGNDASVTASLLYKHIQKYNQTKNASIEMVKCMTFSDLLKKYPSFDPNVLITDVEGYEYELLKSISWDYPLFRPNIIMFENKHMKSNEQIEIHELLTTKGYSVVYQGNLDVIYVHSSYKRRWIEQTNYKANAELTPMKVFIVLFAYVSICIFGYLMLNSYVSKMASIILLIAGALVISIKLLPSYFNEIIHTKLIHLPFWMKCGININCNDKSCGIKSLNNLESQSNADIDVYSLCHIILWAILAFIDPKITFGIVVGVSLIWETFEIAMGCIGVPIHGRLTDILISIIGYLIGASFRI